MSTTTYAVQYQHYYGIIDEIKEGYFGGVRPLKYVDLDGKAPECGKYDNPQKINTQGGRIIQGIGITEWNDGECNSRSQTADDDCEKVHNDCYDHRIHQRHRCRFQAKNQGG